MLIFPPDNHPQENCTTNEAVIAYFKQMCPFLKPVIRLEDAAVLRQGLVSKILRVRCDRMHAGDRIMLVGDAVDAVSPSIGQGCNASLQDVQVFAQCLDSSLTKDLHKLDTSLKYLLVIFKAW